MPSISAKPSGQIEDLTQKLAEATAQRGRKTLYAPISGIVQASIVGTVGQVVAPSQEVMRIGKQLQRASSNASQVLTARARNPAA